MSEHQLRDLYELWRTTDGSTPEVEIIERALLAAVDGAVASRLNETGSADGDDIALFELHRIRDRYLAGDVAAPRMEGTP